MGPSFFVGVAFGVDRCELTCEFSRELTLEPAWLFDLLPTNILTLL